MNLLRRLTRTTGSGAFIPEVDGLRFIAIGAVILHHITSTYLVATQRFGPVKLPAQWWEVTPQSKAVAIGFTGYFGVNLFFVISGFILALPFVRSYREGTPRPHLVSYYLRRIVRLEAPYMTAMLVSFVVIVFTNVGWRGFVPHLLSTLVYLHGPVYGQASWVNGVAWSLEVEVQFYLVMPLLALVFAVRPAAIRRTVLVAAILAGAWLAVVVSRGDLHPKLELSLLKYLQFFLAGFLLADLYHERSANGFTREWHWDAIAACSGVAIFVILTERYRLFLLTPFFIALMYAGLFLGRVGHRLITNPAIVVIGGMCYTTYLYHMLIIHWLAPSTMTLTRLTPWPSIDLLVQSVLLVPPILLASVIMFLLVEKPFMNLSRTVNRRFRAAGNAAVPSHAVLAETVGKP